MAIDAVIVSLSQDMDLETGSMSNFMLLRLPSGDVVRALIDDAAAQVIVRLAVDGKATTQPPPPSDEEPETHVFGGEPGAERFTARVEAVGELDTTVLAASEPPPPPRRPLRVDKDEYGYPVVALQGGVDPREFTGSRDRDEDGVGQI